jgi:hypothetical protein
MHVGNPAPAPVNGYVEVHADKVLEMLAGELLDQVRLADLAGSAHHQGAPVQAVLPINQFLHDSPMH